MLTRVDDFLNGVEGEMLALVRKWGDINSYSGNLEGLKMQALEIEKAFGCLGSSFQSIFCPDIEVVGDDGAVTRQKIGPVATFCKRPEAAKQLLLVCHMDTVYPPELGFDSTQLLDSVLSGPGVCDAKAGIVIMLYVLKALEASDLKNAIGWKVVINSDEEMGSPGSGKWLSGEAKHYDMGLVFEPCLPDGSIVEARKGSGNFSLVVKGKSAHAGREHHLGVNAIDSLAQCVTSLSSLNGKREGLTVNVGLVRGGGPVNVVPDLAIAKFNIRMEKLEDQEFCHTEIERMIKERQAKDRTTIELHGEFNAPPKVKTKEVKIILDQLAKYASEIDMDLKFQKTGGVCDGNRLQAAGLPTVDTLGARGGSIHSVEEYLDTSSLVQRAKLTLLLLSGWIKGEWDFERAK